MGSPSELRGLHRQSLINVCNPLAGPVALNQGRFCPQPETFGNVRRCLVVKTWGAGEAKGIRWAEIRLPGTRNAQGSPTSKQRLAAAPPQSSAWPTVSAVPGGECWFRATLDTEQTLNIGRMSPSATFFFTCRHHADKLMWSTNTWTPHVRSVRCVPSI